MKKKIVTVLAAGIIGFSGISFAENEATFDPATGVLHIPKVIVGTTEYQVDMQKTKDWDFSVINATSTQAVGGVWRLMAMGCSAYHPPHDDATMTMYAKSACQTWSQSYLGEYRCMEFRGIELWHALCR